MSDNEIIVENSSLVISEQWSDPNELYGYYAKRSSLCDICQSDIHMKINLYRSREYFSLKEICKKFEISPELLKTHFQNHYILSPKSQQIINLKESDSQEAKEIISYVFEKNIDLMDGIDAVLKAKVKRLHPITMRIQEIADLQEKEDLTDTEKQEYIMLNRLATETEDGISKLIINREKMMFPFKREEITQALMSFKMEVLKKIIDSFVLKLIKLEKVNTHYKEVVQELRSALSSAFNQMEEEIIKTSGLTKKEND